MGPGEPKCVWGSTHQVRSMAGAAAGVSGKTGRSSVAAAAGGCVHRTAKTAAASPSATKPPNSAVMPNAFRYGSNATTKLPRAAAVRGPQIHHCGSGFRQHQAERCCPECADQDYVRSPARSDQHYRCDDLVGHLDNRGDSDVTGSPVIRDNTVIRAQRTAIEGGREGCTIEITGNAGIEQT